MCSYLFNFISILASFFFFLSSFLNFCCSFFSKLNIFSNYFSLTFLFVDFCFVLFCCVFLCFCGGGGFLPDYEWLLLHCRILLLFTLFPSSFFCLRFSLISLFHSFFFYFFIFSDKVPLISLLTFFFLFWLCITPSSIFGYSRRVIVKAQDFEIIKRGFELQSCY